MKRKFLEDLGFEKEIIDRVMAENGEDIEAQKKVTANALFERDGLKERLDMALNELKAFEDADINTLKGEITRLSTELVSNQSKITKLKSQAETESFFNSLEKKFINGETKEYYFNKLEDALENESFRGKNRSEILDSLVKDEKGETKKDIFRSEETSPQKLIMPPSGRTVADITKDTFKTMDYNERLNLFKDNPNLYQTLKE